MTSNVRKKSIVLFIGGLPVNIRNVSLRWIPKFVDEFTHKILVLFIGRVPVNVKNIIMCRIPKFVDGLTHEIHEN